MLLLWFPLLGAIARPVSRLTVKSIVTLAMDSTENSTASSTRMTRIRTQIPLRVTSMEAQAPFSEAAHTLVVNTMGCGVRLSRPLEPGQEVCLDELPTGKIATARVANCVPLGAGSAYWVVGLALDAPGNIWGIHPAPSDWGPEAAADAATVTAPPGKSAEWPYRQFSDRGEFHPGRR